MPIVKLTQNVINNDLQCPVGKSRIEYCDQELPGLYIEVRATSPGQGSYYLRFKNANGKTCHIKIARTTEMSLADARKHAKTLKAEIALGADPKAKSQASKAVPTYAEFFEQQYLPYVFGDNYPVRFDDNYLDRLTDTKDNGEFHFDRELTLAWKTYHSTSREFIYEQTSTRPKPANGGGAGSYF